MFINSLLWQGNGEAPLLVAVLLDLGSLVLEPDLQLRLGQSQLTAEVLPPLLGQVLVGSELSLQSLQLVGVEGGPLFLLCAALRSLRLPLALLPVPAPWGPVGVSGCEDPGWDVGEVNLAGDVRCVGGVAQVHRQLGLFLDCDLRRGQSAEVRTEDVVNGEWEVGGGWAARGEWGGRDVWVRRSTASLREVEILLSLSLLELVVTEEWVKHDDVLSRGLSDWDWLSTSLTSLIYRQADRPGLAGRRLPNLLGVTKLRSTISKLDLVHRSICVAFDILILTFLLSLSYLIICNFLSISLSCSIHSWQERWWRCFKIILSQVVYTPAQTVQTVSPLCARLLQDITAGQLGVPAPCRILLQVTGHQAPPPPGPRPPTL